MRLTALLWATAALASAQQESADELIHRAKLLAREQKAEAAAALLQQAAELAPRSAEPLLLLGNVKAFLQGDVSAGAALYRRAIAVDPSYDAHFFLGKVLGMQGQYAESAEAFGGAHALRPDSAVALTEQGNAYIAAGSWAKAHTTLRSAAMLEPYSPEPLLAIAKAAAGSGQPRDVVLAAWRELSELHPWHSSHLLQHAMLLLSATDAPTATDAAPSSAAALPSLSPRACDLADAVAVLQPGVNLPAPLPRACGAEVKAAALPPPPSAAEKAAALALRGTACQLLSEAPWLAPHAKAEGEYNCTVRLPAGFSARLHTPAGRGLLVRRGLHLSVFGDELGEPATLDMGGLSRHFLVANGSLSLRHLTLHGGRALLSGGGSLLLLPPSRLSARALSFRRNRAVLGSGGAIAARGAGCTLSLTQVRFEENSASLRGGALSLNAHAGGSEGDLSLASTLEEVSWVRNAAGHGAANMQRSEGEVEAEAESEAEAETEAEAEAEGGSLYSGAMLESLELQSEALELFEVKGLEPQALALLTRAAEADRASPTAFASSLQHLYELGHDAAAAERLLAFEKAQPGHAALDEFRQQLRNESAPALASRGRSLNAQVASMREGERSASAHPTRQVAQDGATMAFLQAAALSPADGDVWHDLGTSLFFAGELAEAGRVYVHGAALAPEHGGLQQEAALRAAFPLPPKEADERVGAFGDDSFERHAMPEGAYGDRPESLDIQAGAEVFGARPSAFVSLTPLLSREECRQAISLANTWAERHGGWTTNRHHTVATTDVPLVSLPEALPWFNAALATKLLPALASRYPGAAPLVSKLRVLDCFLVRYSAQEQRELPTHSDQSLLSFTIALNDPSEYEGGGTHFPALGRALDAPAAGHAVLFPGKLEHGGNRISKGTRYIIVLFMGYERNRSGRGEGYVMREYERLRAAALELGGGASGTSWSQEAKYFAAPAPAGKQEL